MRWHRPLGACLSHRGTTGADGVRAPRRRDASKTKDKQVGAGSRLHAKGAVAVLFYPIKCLLELLLLPD